MLMCGYLNNVTLVNDCVNNKIEFGRGELEDAFLNHMVPIQIVYQNDNLVDRGELLRKPSDDHIYLSLSFNGIDDLLQRARPVLVDGNLKHMWINALYQLCFLVGSQELAKFLDQIVAKRVQNEFQEKGMDLVVHEVSHRMTFLRRLELFLQETAPELVGCELDVVELFERDQIQVSSVVSERVGGGSGR